MCLQQPVYQIVNKVLSNIYLSQQLVIDEKHLLGGLQSSPPKKVLKFSTFFKKKNTSIPKVLKSQTIVIAKPVFNITAFVVKKKPLKLNRNKEKLLQLQLWLWPSPSHFSQGVFFAVLWEMVRLFSQEIQAEIQFVHVWNGYCFCQLLYRNAAAF